MTLPRLPMALTTAATVVVLMLAAWMGPAQTAAGKKPPWPVSNRARRPFSPADRTGLPVTVAAPNTTGPTAPTATLTLIAQQDSWVNENTPSTNYGADERLVVGHVLAEPRSYNLGTLLWFDLSGLPRGATVSVAQLWLYQVRAQGAAEYQVWPLAIWDAWDEATVTWENKPRAFSLDDPATSLDSSEGWKAWDVTRIVQNWAWGEIENYGILLQGDGQVGGLRVFHARDVKGMEPWLVIEYMPPSECQELFSPEDIPAPGLIDFDDLPHGAIIDAHYQPSYGVRFENSEITRATIYGNEPEEAQSPPNVASNSAVFPNTSANVPMQIFFDEPKTHVGFWMGNGENTGIGGVLTVYDATGEPICQVRNAPVPEPHVEFIGIYDPQGRIVSVSLDYGDTFLAESIDDLYFAPYTPPTTTPTSTSTVGPTDTPTLSPTATPTASPTATNTPTDTPTASLTPTPTDTPTTTPTASPTTATKVPTATATASPTATRIPPLTPTATPAPWAILELNYRTGAPGSFFTLRGRRFPPNSVAVIEVNRVRLGTVPTNGLGRFIFLLNTEGADPGFYIVTTTVNPRGVGFFSLNPEEPVRPPEGDGPVYDVPPGIAYAGLVYLPLILGP